MADRKKDVNTTQMFQLLFEEEINYPSINQMGQVLANHMGHTHIIEDESMHAFYLNDLADAQEVEKPVAPIVSIFPLSPLQEEFTPKEKANMTFNLALRDEILSKASYTVLAATMFDTLAYSIMRMQLDLRFLDALLDIFPTCIGIIVHQTGRLITPEIIKESRKNDLYGRYVDLIINARYFHIEERENQYLIDTLGMELVSFPDLQYHFHNIDFLLVRGHALMYAEYVLSRQKALEEGEEIYGIKNGDLSKDVLWTCHYEESGVAPKRTLVDIHMGEFRP